MYKQQQDNQRAIVNTTTMCQTQRQLCAMCSKSMRAHIQGKHNNHKRKRTNFRYRCAVTFSNIITLMAIGHNTKHTKVNISIIQIMNTIFCCVAAKLRALLWRVVAKNCSQRHNTWSCRCEMKNVIIVQLVYFLSLRIFDFAFLCMFVVAGWRVFHFWFLHAAQIIARRYAAAKYRLHE